MAVEVAKRLGASRVVGAGRNAERLGLLGAVGADEVIPLTGNSEETGERLAHAAAEVDIVVDYLWGESRDPRHDVDRAGTGRTQPSA